MQYIDNTFIDVLEKKQKKLKQNTLAILFFNIVNSFIVKIRLSLLRYHLQHKIHKFKLIFFL